MLAAVVITAAAAASSYSIAAPGLTLSNVDDRAGTAYLNFFTHQLETRASVNVVTTGEIATILGMERQRQLLGCTDSDSASCIAEMAGALNVDAMISGSLAQTESKGWVLALKLVDARTAESLASYSTRVATDDALYDALAEAAGQMAADLRRKRLDLRAGGPKRHWAWMPTAAGAVIAGAFSAGLYVSARADRDRLAGMEPIMGIATGADLDAYVSSGRTREQASFGLLIGAAILAVAAVALFALLEVGE